MPDRPTENDALEPEELDDWLAEIGEPELDPEPGPGGVYRIDCTVNGRYYIGRARDLIEREAIHWNSLDTGDHYNQEMQDDYNKHGRDSFTFTILEELPHIDDQKMAEQALLDKHIDDPKCYNVLEWAGWLPT